MPEWPKYLSHKVVSAAEIVEIVEHGGTLSLLVKPYGDHTVERFEATEPAMTARAEVGWYAVKYDNGFQSVSPGDEFRKGYVLLQEG